MAVSTIPWGRDIPKASSEEALEKHWAYWQNRINRASLVMLKEEGIVSAEQAKTIARAQKRAEEIQAEPDRAEIQDIMPLEKLLIEECGQLATLIHTGRSRQDIFATLYQARLRLSLLDFYDELNVLRSTMLKIAKDHVKTWMPAYTNGVQAMPITLGFYLWAFLESFERDADRLQEAWARVNQTALGTAVLACSAWPLSRSRLAELLGFDSPIENGLDSSQVSLFDIPIEAAGIASNVAVRITTLMQDIAQQYSQVRPWLLLDQTAAYGSSAMPQKRNPGIINKTRGRASDVIGAAHTVTIRAHNLNLGMFDNKDSISDDSNAVYAKAVYMLELANWAFSMLKVNPERALEELNNDWTCTMALAETLQMRFAVPFRVGHTFASQIVTEARANGWLPMTFPYEEAQRVYSDITQKLLGETGSLPLSDAEFRETLTPEYVVKTRVGLGCPSPESTESGLKKIEERLAIDSQWCALKRDQLKQADAVLDKEFEKLF
ncbi:MAG: argininosuccinate lyase [Burkholderiaceae bacterium]|nr:argininosuccinate lyase [Burkholderiaceae bacterium]